MLGLLHKINSRLSKAVAKPVQQPTLPSKPGANTDSWSPAEVELLLHCERNPVIFEVRPSTQDSSANTSYTTCIIGVDLINNELLLDSLFPSPPIEQRADGNPFWIHVTLEAGSYAIYVKPEYDSTTRGILVRILATRFNPANTSHLETQYADNCGPQMKLRIQDGQVVRGTITRLSVSGACVAVTDMPNHRSPAMTDADCDLVFNAHFRIHCHGRMVRSVKQPAQKRKLIYLQFDSLSVDDRAQLIAYLTACNKPTNNIAA